MNERRPWRERYVERAATLVCVARCKSKSITPAVSAAFGRRLRAWYRRNHRDLPWRRTRDPYHVLVSELMLQQTQVSRVLEFYARFIERFPTMQHLAAAPPKRVMESWEGLGYYARARNLHKLARHVTREGGPGVLLPEPQKLRRVAGDRRLYRGRGGEFRI